MALHHGVPSEKTEKVIFDLAASERRLSQRSAFTTMQWMFKLQGMLQAFGCLLNWVRSVHLFKFSKLYEYGNAQVPRSPYTDSAGAPTWGFDRAGVRG